jgi:hypothetical protein
MLVILIDLDASINLAYDGLFGLLSRPLRMLVASSIAASSVIAVFYFQKLEPLASSLGTLSKVMRVAISYDGRRYFLKCRVISAVVT